MPRNLAKLRFKAPKPPTPLNLSKIHPDNHGALENRLRIHVQELSKPTTPLNLQNVVDPRWKKQPGKKAHRLARKPLSVKDLVDPAAKAKHGQIIYVFAHIRTGQVIYSLSQHLDTYHLDQLPFIGKHSKPPTLRPDVWKPHCVVTFPFPEQGLQAFRKLREFRMLHETSWQKTNPEWLRLGPKQRMKKIMDQVANTSADLAAVLSAQERQAELMRKNIETRDSAAKKIMASKWPGVLELAKRSLAEDKKDAENPEWLERQIASLTRQLELKNNQNEADQKRINEAKRSHEIRLNRIMSARRRAEQYEKMQLEAEPASLPGAEEKLAKLKEEAQALEARLAAPFVPRTAKELANEQDDLKQQQAEITKLEAAFAAKKQIDSGDHPIARSVLPPHLQKTLPQPFTMDVEIKWTDLRNAEYAAGNWPAAVTHDMLDLHSARQGLHYLSAEQYAQAVEDEVQGMMKELERKQREEEGGVAGEVAGEEEKTGVWKYIPEVRNPFKRASV